MVLFWLVSLERKKESLFPSEVSGMLVVVWVGWGVVIPSIHTSGCSQVIQNTS